MNNGIYRIRNLVNTKLYLGSAAGKSGFDKRWNNHISELQRNVHSNRHLQRAWNKHGESAFVFEIIEHIIRLEEMTDEKWKTLILQREQYYLDTILFANCNDQRFYKLGYNVCRIAGNSTGVQHTDQSKANMSAAKIGKLNSFFGKTHTIETKDKIRKAQLGRKHTEEHKRKVGKASAKNQLGEGNSHAKLTTNNVKKIKHLLKLGNSNNSIAKKFGVTRPCISDINTGKTWSHVK